MTNDEEPLTRLEELAVQVANRATYEQANRRGLLWVHALVGILAGVQMYLFGSAGTIENLMGVEARLVLAMLGVVGGVNLAVGLLQRPRSLMLEVVGLSLVGLWDLLMAGGLAVARIQQADYHIIPIGKPLPDGYVVAYPVTVYAGLLALVSIHLFTLWRFRRAGVKL